MSLVALFSRELKTALRARAAIVNPLAFLLLGLLLFTIAVPHEVAERAVDVAPGIVWVLVLLTTMLSLDSLFRRDFENGVLEQLLLNAASPSTVIGVRLLAQWLTTGGLITLISPLLGLLLGLPASWLGSLALSLLIGTPALSLFGAIGAGLTVGFSRGGVLLGLLVLPLFIPVLIFGAASVPPADHAQMGGVAQLYWLGFISMLAVTIAPLATTAALKISVQMQ